MAKLHDALANSDKPERRQQAAGWKLYKAAEPGPNGTVLYVNVLSPALKGADYTISKILDEVFPQEVQQLFPLYRDSFAGLARAELSLVQDFGTPAEPKPPPASRRRRTGVGAEGVVRRVGRCACRHVSQARHAPAARPAPAFRTPGSLPRRTAAACWIAATSNRSSA